MVTGFSNGKRRYVNILEPSEPHDRKNKALTYMMVAHVLASTQSHTLLATLNN